MEDTFKLPTACRVTLTIRNGSTFIGILHSFNEATGKIVLKSVTTDGAKLYGPQIFYKSDLIHIEDLNESNGIIRKTRSGSNKTECQDSRNVPEDRISCRPLELENYDSDELARANIIRDDNRGQAIGSEGDHVACKNDYYEENGYIFISRMCEKYYDAIMYIMDQKVIGVTFEGVNIGRDGTLSLIQISTETDIFAFDILQLGEQAFEEGLQALFEASNIVKVIHDCRWISDMMHERYNIHMVNIFDTQVADVFVYKIMHNGSWPQCVESLPDCLTKHLNLPRDNHFVKNGRQKYEMNESIWLQRPLTDKILLTARESVSLLIELYKVLNNKLLHEFRLGVDMYLNHVRNLNGDIESCLMNRHILPSIFLEIPKLVSYTSSNNRAQNQLKSFQDNHFNVTEQPVVFNHNAAAHRSNGSSTCRTDSETAVVDSTDHYKPLFKSGSINKMNNGVNISGSNTKVNSITESNNTKLNTAKHQDVSYLKEEIKVSSVEPVHSSSVRCSKLWQSAHAEEYREMPELSCYLAAPTDNSNRHVVTDSGIENGMMREKVPENRKSIREALQNLARLARAAKLVGRVPSKSSDFNESIVATCASDIQDIAHTSSSPESIHSSPSCIDSDSSLADHVHTDLDMSSILPAGFKQMTVSKKKMRNIQRKSNSQDDHDNETVFLPPLLLEDDLSCIPMQSALKRHQELPLGMTCEIGDPISDSEYNLQQSENQDSLIKAHLACNGQSSIKESDIEQFEQSKMFQKVLKIASSSSHGSLQLKLLPPKTTPFVNSTNIRQN